MKFLNGYRTYCLIALYLSSNAYASHFKNNCGAEVVSAAKADYEFVELNKNSFSQKIQARRSSGITNSAIAQAKKLQHEFKVFNNPTPFYTNKNINQFAQKILNHKIIIYLKDETVNPTGSFKDRMPIGFYNKVSQTIQAAKQNVSNTYTIKAIAVSTGNHGRAVAYAANIANDYLRKVNLQNNFHIYSEITMSANTLTHKKLAISNLGANIRDHYADSKIIPNYSEAENLVVNDAMSDPKNTILLLHADKNAVSGYAVIADEMIQQAQNNGIDLAKVNPGEVLMLVPLGSGGLLSGTEEISVRYPNVYSIGVTAAPADMTYRSLKFCKLIRTEEPYPEKLIVDGVMATPEPFSLKRIEEVAKDVVLVKQEDAVYATALFRKHGINVEPTSGLPLAALLLGVNKDYKNAHYAFIVLTGKNISSEMEDKVVKLSAQDIDVIFNYFKRRRDEIIKALA